MLHEGPHTRLDEFTQVITIAADDPASARSHQVAGGGARFLAGLADVSLQLLGFTVMVYVAITYRPDMFPPKSWVWAGPVAFVEWHIIYLMLFESFTRGTTPGKSLIGIRVVSKYGNLPRPTATVVRNIARIIDLVFFCYAGAMALMSGKERRQRLGDRIAGTIVIYSRPLTEQMQLAQVPESLYSTSEDGYLLQAWIERENSFDEDSRLASATDLAAYLHQKYGDADEKSKAPIRYLHELYYAETRANE